MLPTVDSVRGRPELGFCFEIVVNGSYRIGAPHNYYLDSHSAIFRAESPSHVQTWIEKIQAKLTAAKSEPVGPPPPPGPPADAWLPMCPPPPPRQEVDVTFEANVVNFFVYLPVGEAKKLYLGVQGDAEISSLVWTIASNGRQLENGKPFSAQGCGLSTKIISTMPSATVPGTLPLAPGPLPPPPPV